MDLVIDHFAFHLEQVNLLSKSMNGLQAKPPLTVVSERDNQGRMSDFMVMLSKVR